VFAVVRLQARRFGLAVEKRTLASQFVRQIWRAEAFTAILVTHGLGRFSFSAGQISSSTWSGPSCQRKRIFLKRQWKLRFPPVRWTQQAARQYDGEVVPGKDPMKRPIYWFTVRPL
jgi:hypothetical protein